MKGLLIKDYKLIWHNKKLFLIMLVVMFIALQNYTNYSFLIAYNTMICILLVMNTMSMDEYYKSTAYLMTLPIKRKDYVAEKYIIMFAFSIAGAALSTIVCILLHPEMISEHIAIALLVYAIMALLQLVLLPVQLKFGNEKGRVVLAGLLGCITVITTAVVKGFPKLFDMEDGLGAIFKNIVAGFLSLEKPVMVMIVCLVFGTLVFISYSISKGIMCKKEF